MSRARKFLCIVVIFAVLHFVVAEANALEIELPLTGVVDKVVDGDTFHVTIKNGTQYTVRLADLNANEIGQAGYQEAKDFLSSLVFGKTVCLDVDDLYLWDYHGTGDRLVCVVYIDYNATHLLNVNKAIIDSGNARIIDYENEFNPHAWSLYVPKETIPEFPSFLILLYIGIGTIVTAGFFRLGRMHTGERLETTSASQFRFCIYLT